MVVVYGGFVFLQDGSEPFPPGTDLSPPAGQSSEMLSLLPVCTSFFKETIRGQSDPEPRPQPPTPTHLKGLFVR